MKVESEFPSTCEAELIVATELRHEHLDRLYVKRDALAIEIPNLFAEAECEFLANRIIQDGAKARYLAEPLFIKACGDSWFDQKTDRMRKEYLENADRMMNAKRALYAPVECPIERLHAMIDRCWPDGAAIQHIEGRRMYYGLPRVLNSEGQVHPHVDVITWDSPNADGLEGYRSQAAVNIYLRMPKRGGELALWWQSYSQEEYEALRDFTNDYGLDVAKIGPPALVIQPRRGSAILFDSSRVHSVYEASDPRVTASAFCGYYGAHRPLTFWS